MGMEGVVLKEVEKFNTRRWRSEDHYAVQMSPDGNTLIT